MPENERIKNLFAMMEYIVEESFTLKHIKALADIAYLFNWSVESEKEIFEFAEHLRERYEKAKIESCL